MGGHRFKKCFVMIVRDIKLTGGLLNDRADGRIVNTANFWEKMVFDLKIEAAYKPAKRLIIAGKM